MVLDHCIAWSYYGVNYHHILAKTISSYVRLILFVKFHYLRTPNFFFLKKVLSVTIHWIIITIKALYQTFWDIEQCIVTLKIRLKHCPLVGTFLNIQIYIHWLVPIAYNLQLYYRQASFLFLVLFLVILTPVFFPRWFEERVCLRVFCALTEHVNIMIEINIILL